MAGGIAHLDADVLALDIAEIAQSGSKVVEQPRLQVLRENADAMQLLVAP
jgi:hypothetical protein